MPEQVRESVAYAGFLDLSRSFCETPTKPASDLASHMNTNRWPLIVAGLLLALAVCAMLAAALFALGLL